jgi:hypothetical protein
MFPQWAMRINTPPRPGIITFWGAGGGWGERGFEHMMERQLEQQNSLSLSVSKGLNPLAVGADSMLMWQRGREPDEPLLNERLAECIKLGLTWQHSRGPLYCC